jgi:hypothetical protein
MKRAFSSAGQWLFVHSTARVVLLAAVVGVACLVVIPPWWHYDEPGHFEYAWLAAHSRAWPEPGQYSQDMRRQMAVSMQRYGWYGIRNFRLDLKSPEPVPIGVPQTGDQPGYYFLASLPLRLLSDADITVQYYAVRLFSFALYLLIVLVAWYALGEILPDGHPLRWMATTFVAVLPAFADEMISVNNDVSAVLAASLGLWACLRLIQRGFSAGRLLFLALSLAACYLTKSTALFVIILAPLALLLALLHRRQAAYLWGAIGLAVLLLAALVLVPGGARAWYGAGGDGTARVQQANAPLGTSAFRLNDSLPGVSTQLLQTVPPDQLKSLRRKDDTFGFWLWADQPTQAGPIFVEFTTRSGVKTGSSQDLLDVGTKPAWHQFTFHVPGDAASAAIYIRQSAHGLPGNSVFVDGLVLAPGSFTAPPELSDPNGTHGTWEGHAFTNVVRNSSAESGSLQIRRSFDARTAGVLGSAGISLGSTLCMLQDWVGTGWYYHGALATLFRTFWVSLAGDKAVIPGSAVSAFLMVLTVAGVLGALLRLWSRRLSLRWNVIGFLAIALLVPWLFALIRGSADVLRGNVLYPWARYAFPAILPTALLLCAGWMEWLERLALPLNLTPRARDGIVYGIMSGLFLFALANAIRVFHPDWWDNGILLALLLLFQALIFTLYVRWSPPPASPASIS